MDRRRNQIIPLLLLILSIISNLQSSNGFSIQSFQTNVCRNLQNIELNKWSQLKIGKNANNNYVNQIIYKPRYYHVTNLYAAPKEALSDIVIPGIFDFSKDELESISTSTSSSTSSSSTSKTKTSEEDPRIWVPQTECLSFRPLCFCVSQGYYVNLLKFKGGGILGKHRHSSPVHALTLKGSWGYKEHDWNAKPGTYVFEPPGETHTLVVDDDCEEMISLFHVTGSLLYVDENGDDIVGFDDVFSKLEKAKKWYKECGLGEDYVQQFVR